MIKTALEKAFRSVDQDGGLGLFRECLWWITMKMKIWIKEMKHIP